MSVLSIAGWPRKSLLAAAGLASLAAAFGSAFALPARADGPPPPAAQPLPRLQPFHDPEHDVVVTFLQDRVARDPGDIGAENRLAAECLRRLRVTGDLLWLPRAAEAARRSLASVPETQNFPGLLMQARVEYDSHRFQTACETAQRLASLDWRLASTWAILGDARLEAGDYDQAAAAYARMRQAALNADGDTPDVETRLARLAWARGDDAAARSDIEKALALAQAQTYVSPENIAYCQVQLGQLDFGTGHWPDAEVHYRKALDAFPSSYPALEHLAELAGARGDLPGAVALYQEVIAQVPRPEFYQELADLYLFFGKPNEAQPWADKALAAYNDSTARGQALFYHQLASFFCDTRQSPADALAWAKKDMELRHSVFAHDSLAWALYKSGRFTEAAQEMDQAVALGTRSGHILAHAGMVYFRAGDPKKGAEFLRRTYEVNPYQDTFHVHR